MPRTNKGFDTAVYVDMFKVYILKTKTLKLVLKKKSERNKMMYMKSVYQDVTITLVDSPVRDSVFLAEVLFTL